MIEFIIGVAILIYLSNKNNNQNGGSLENYHNTLGIDHSQPLKNLYGETIQPCKLRENDQRGSWDSDGLCSELGGGVHQICFRLNESTKNFSSDTGQSNWSAEDRLKNLDVKTNQHCMCLGAWALYKAKQEAGNLENTSGELVCDSIPEVALSESYVGKWSTWNGNELSNQIVNGVNSLFTQCYESENNNAKKDYLKNKYCDFAVKNESLKKSDVYTKNCKN